MRRLLHRAVHQLAHPAHLVGERGVEHLDRSCAGPERRVAVLAHVPERRLTPGAGLGIEAILRLKQGFGRLFLVVWVAPWA